MSLVARSVGIASATAIKVAVPYPSLSPPPSSIVAASSVNTICIRVAHLRTVQAAQAVKQLKLLKPYCVTTHRCIATHLYTLLKTGFKLLKRGLNLEFIASYYFPALQQLSNICDPIKPREASNFNPLAPAAPVPGSEGNIAQMPTTGVGTASTANQPAVPSPKTASTIGVLTIFALANTGGPTAATAAIAAGPIPNTSPAVSSVITETAGGH
ncbi:hypothetical protein B0H13DRAFT_1911667 [Mycena leptocephala]|nr:hypothetical protein B0H13DRAFT_1911667 [Mycena leptocephala]